MPRPPALTPDEREAALLLLPGWTVEEDGTAIRRLFVFASFEAAFGFMAQAALHAARIDHHPDWSNSYRRVDVRLTTHTAGTLTGLDIELAQAMDRIAAGTGGAEGVP